MTKDILISISGLQYDTEGTEPVEIIRVGNYYYKNEKHYVIFDEVSDDSKETTKNTVKISKNKIEIIKKGSSNVHMLFEVNKKSISQYNMPFGEVSVGINTRSLEVKEDENLLNVKISYLLDLNCVHISNCKININIKSL